MGMVIDAQDEGTGSSYKTLVLSTMLILIAVVKRRKSRAIS
jgi:hypothetical protein